MKKCLAVLAATLAAIEAFAAVPVPCDVGDPRTWAVEDAGISNFYGRVKGVEPVWIEGEPLAGKPTRIFAWWGLPNGASAASKVPAMVLVHGGGGTAFAKWVKTWNERGYAAIAMDTCGKAPRGERGGKPHPEHEWSGPSGWGSSFAQVDRPLKDQWTYHAIAAIMRAHSFIRGRPEVDAERTGITGISWGGYLTSIAMCVDRRFKFAAPVYGCGFYELNPEWDAMNGDPAIRSKWFALWDAKNYLRYAAESGGVACPVLWCDGTNDRWYTLEMLKRSCDLLGPSVSLAMSIKLRMPHGHPPHGDPKEITACADHYLKGGPRPAKIEGAHVDGSRLVVDFSEGGMKVVGAEFLWTCATNVVLRDREWLSRPADEFDAAGGRCAATLPQGVVMFLMSLTTADGLKFSTGPFEREDVSRDCGARHSCGIIHENK